MAKKPAKKSQQSAAELDPDLLALIAGAELSTEEDEKFYDTNGNSVYLMIDRNIEFMEAKTKGKSGKKLPKKLKQTIQELIEDSDEPDEPDEPEEDDISVEEVPVVKKNVKQIIKSGDFWRTHIKPLGWCDLDESKRTRDMVVNAIPSIEKRMELREIIRDLSVPLYLVLAEEKAFLGLHEYDQKNMMAHIIAKGKEFYDIVLSAPGVAMYLIEGPPEKHQYQKLLDLL